MPTFIDELELTQLRTHPSNPRKKAKADPDMVASVKESGLLQALVVAPTGDEATPYVLIDGHRRHDALKKARIKVAPAVVREDLATEGDQVQAMILASLYRENLTPVEEAEAFEQLRDLKWSQTKISKTTGVPVATVRERLKLLKLSKPTQAKIHKGQLSLGNALDLVSFDDDPDTQAKLVKAAGTYNWDWQLQAAKRQRKARAHADDVEAQLVAAGTPRCEVPADRGWYGIRSVTQGPVEIDATHSQEPGDHDGCYAYVRFDDYAGDPVIKLVCTSPGSHEITETDAERRRREEWEARDAEREAEEERQAIARDLRAKAVAGVADDVVLPPPVVDLLRALLPHLLLALDPVASSKYCELNDIDPDVAWSAMGVCYRQPEREAFEAHVATLTTAPPAALTASLVTVLVASAEMNLSHHYGHSPLVERYYELLEQLEHHRSDVDDEILARHRGESDSETAPA